MTSDPQTENDSDRATLAIRALARAQNADVQELQTLYVLEAFLARLALSEYRDDFVLKGGVLLAAFAARRPTKDIDVRASGVSNDERAVLERVRAIADLTVEDGVRFDSASLAAVTIRDGDAEDYSGVRVKMVGFVGKSRLTIGIDVSFGDPIWPAPRDIDLPRLIDLGLPAVRLKGYPLVMVIAEKVVTAMHRGAGNTRWRDFADVYLLMRSHAFSAEQIRAAVIVVAEHRGTKVSALLPTLEGMPRRAQPKWKAWRRRIGREADLPEQFAEVLSGVASFIDPIARGGAKGEWDPAQLRWVSP
ncbi:nucleotidyl transferase AbiEii/AbiGii toxin family protein [Leucobacter sp. cx-328]|uniref:nucleotidyl transferase AbiEii/AbiGii toxin family protein n=1 Tax=unclassified Leucobacter TaxID=2621730 RepID=UPI00165D3599|nr:nucleotidyl transferase AbiEii/AbiGii toxin family protein [Leucobacter sp. cx-328]